MSTITINGNIIQMNNSGNSVIISNGKVVVNGKDVTPDSKEITISVQGNVDILQADCCNKISVTGDVGSIKTQSGSVDVNGSVKGSVQTKSGSVDCDNISGDVSTMSGSIRNRK